MKFHYKEIFLTLGLIFFLGCSNTRKNDNHKHKEPNFQGINVNIDNFYIEELSEKSHAYITQWWSFKSLYQSLIKIAPKSASESFLRDINSDSLIVFRRFYMNSATLTNARIEKDWRSRETSADTVFRFLKTRKTEVSSLQWEEPLLENIDYSFRIRAKKSSVKSVTFSIDFAKEKKSFYHQVLNLDSISKNIALPYTTLTELDDSWVQITIDFHSPKSKNAVFSISLDEDLSANDYILLYRAELLIPLKKSMEINHLANKEKLSQRDIYRWLYQIDDELKQLWAKNDIPPHIKDAGLLARLKLFETYVQELLSELSQNPNVSENQIKEGIEKIRHSFSAFISYLNHFSQDSSKANFEQLQKQFKQHTN